MSNSSPPGRFGHRVEAVRTHFGRNVRDFMEELGLSRATYYEWLARDEPTPAAIDGILSTFSTVRRQWLVDGVGEMLSGGDGVDTSMVRERTAQYGPERRPFEEIVEITIFTEVYPADKGNGVVYDPGGTTRAAIPRDLLDGLVGFLPPRSIGIMHVEGDAMSPTLEEGDMVIFSPIDELRDEGVYVLLLDRALVARRIQRIAGGGYVIIRDNKYAGYRDEKLVPDDRTEAGGLMNDDTKYRVDFRAVGRVLWPKRSTDKVHVKQVGEIVRSIIRDGSKPPLY